MSSSSRRTVLQLFGRSAVVLAAASLTGGCFQPLYGRPDSGGDSVHDKLTAVEIARIPALQGSPESRLAVALRNALQFDLNGGAGPNAPTHRINIVVSTTQASVIVDVTSGRANALIDSVIANFSLVEIATNKVVLTDATFARASYDIPGSAQRFAKQRAQRDAEDRAVEVVADNIRNRLASFFVAAT